MIVVWRSLLRFLVPVIFFVSTLGLALDVPSDVFVSPDENASSVFATLFATEQQLWLEEPINEQLGGIVHPRSVIAIGERLIPVSFLGLTVLYGSIGSLFGPWILGWLTPIIAMFAVLAWRALVRELWKDDTLANLSAIALMIHPAFWYYAARGMMHNVLFVALLIFAAWFWIVKPLHQCDRHALFDVFASGACIGLALATRGSEIVWIAIAVAALMYVARKTITTVKIATFVIGIAIALLPFATLQTSLYGAPWNTGYTVESEESAESVEEVSTDLSAFDQWLENSTIGSVLLPFGIHEMNIVRNTLNYGLWLYPWVTVLGLIGILLLARDRKYRTWLWLTISVGIWLLIVYGSWSFNDNPDPTAVTIGDSHVRYWLPLFVLMTPFIAHTIIDFSSRWSSKWRFPSRAVGERSIATLIVIVCTLLSINVVFFAPDGVLAARANLYEAAEKRDTILEHTDADDIIIVDYADKYLFPDRRVIVPLRDDRTYGAMNDIVELTDLYYFGITLPQEDIDYLNNEKLAEMELGIESVVEIGEETLYFIEEVDL